MSMLRSGRAAGRRCIGELACAPGAARGRRSTRPTWPSLSSRALSDIPSPAAEKERMPKNFDFAAQEPELYRRWESGGHFKPSETSSEPPFVMTMPPPNVTGRLHMGHAMFSTLADCLVRFHRARGRPTLWTPGCDHAGIATQLVVERALAREGLSRRELGQRAFERRAAAWAAEHQAAIQEQLRALGASCDWTRAAFTLDPGPSRAVTRAFCRLHGRGLVHRGAYLVNWAPGLRTAVSDLEVEYREEEGWMHTFKYLLLPEGWQPVEKEGRAGEEVYRIDSATLRALRPDQDHIPVSTTRPETVLADAAVAVHPEDPRFSRFRRRWAWVPLTDRAVPVVCDAAVDRSFGTGAVKITPGHDAFDHALAQRRGLPALGMLEDDGTIKAGFAVGRAAGLGGLAPREARAQAWELLQAAGLAVAREPHVLRVPRAQRGGEVVEPMVREQWFVRTGPLAAPALAAAREGRLRFVPPRFGGVFERWMEEVRDWCVSRQLWWGHRIPVWYLYASEEEAARGPRKEQRYVVAESEEEARTEAQRVWDELRAATSANLSSLPPSSATSPSVPSPASLPSFSSLPPAPVLRQETDVLDTWFSSALWPFSSLGWPQNTPDLARFYPTSVMETGHDILFFWVARMVMLGLELTDELPFRTVYLHGLVRDGQGRKMSKSLGNVVDPLAVSADVGTDALRWALVTGAAGGQDLTLADTRLQAGRSFVNKLWNVARFSQSLCAEAAGAATCEIPSEGLPLPERWILARAAQTSEEVTCALEHCDFGEAARLIHEFAWSDLADWYVEVAKLRVQGREAGAPLAQQTLLRCLSTVLRLAHPIIPFATEAMWGNLFPEKGMLIEAAWPGPGDATRLDPAQLRHWQSFQDLVRTARNARAEYGVAPGVRGGAAVRARDPDLLAALEREAPVLAALARLDASRLEFALAAKRFPAAAGAVEAVVADGLEVSLPLAGLFDPALELARLEKRQGRLEKELRGLRARLEQPRFLDGAPEAVVAETRAAAEEAEAQLAALGEKLRRVRALAA